MEPVASWCFPLLTAAQMQAIDRYGIEELGIPGIDLMERAGAAVARAAEELAGGGPVAVLCGKGNNGGDGFVAARLLRLAGLRTTVFTTHPPDAYSGDAATALKRLGEEDLVAEAFAPQALADTARALEQAAVLIDGLLGTGFAGLPRGPVAAAIELVNRFAKPVVAIDLPSGVNGSSGEVEGEAVRATRTVTFHLPKVGHYIAPGKWHVGDLQVVGIGLPQDGYSRLAAQEPPIGLVEAGVVGVLPRRTASSNKFTSGQVVVAGGSADLAGAVALAARGALRAGAGYLIACVPAAIRERVSLLCGPEVMTRALPEDGAGAAVPAAVAEVLALLERGGAAVIGNGLGRSEPAAQFGRSLALQAPVPVVLDADGLNAFAGRLKDIAGRPAPTVLTPHGGELERLLAADRGRVARSRLACVREAAARSGAVVVLKGDDTLICAPDGRVAVNDGRAPALATAGSGDLLAGMIGAALAAGVETFAAACAAVYLHAAVGRAAARRRAAEGLLPTELADLLPAVRRRLADGSRGRAGRWRGLKR